MQSLNTASNPALTAALDPRAWEARLLYSRIVHRAWMFGIWAKLSGRRRKLLFPGIAASNAARRLQSWSSPVPVAAVPIASIVGTVQPSVAFDCDFLPVDGHSCEKWLRIADIRMQGLELPPVELVQVDGLYLVRQGHYRISVARALEQETVDALSWQIPQWTLCPEARERMERIRGTRKI